MFSIIYNQILLPLKSALFSVRIIEASVRVLFIGLASKARLISSRIAVDILNYNKN
jgi:hypothetical protein